FSSRRRHTRFSRDWSSDVCSSDLAAGLELFPASHTYPVPDSVPGGHRPEYSGWVLWANFHRVGRFYGGGGLRRLEFWRAYAGHRSEERRVGKGGRDRSWWVRDEWQ